MNTSQRPFRFGAVRTAIIVLMGLSILTIGVATTTSAAQLSLLDSVKGFFGIEKAAIATENAIDRNGTAGRTLLSTTIVISQVYPGGGSSSPTVTYQKDYVELKNISASPQPISGLSLQYGSNVGNIGTATNTVYTLTGSVTLQPGQYY